MHKELLISLADIGAISIECEGCHAQIRMLMDTELKGVVNVPPSEGCHAQIRMLMDTELKGVVNVLPTMPRERASRDSRSGIMLQLSCTGDRRR